MLVLHFYYKKISTGKKKLLLSLSELCARLKYMCSLFSGNGINYLTANVDFFWFP